MSKKWLIIAVVVVIAVLGVVGYRRFLAQRVGAEALTQTTVVRRGPLMVTVSATGSLVPQSEVTLAFQSGGQVAEVLVDEGQVVQAGDALARLDMTDLELQLAAAELDLSIQEATLKELFNPDPSQVAAAEADLAAAYMDYRQQNTDGTSDLEKAEQRLSDALKAQFEAQRAYEAVEDKDSSEAAHKRRALESAKIEAAAARTGYDLVVAGAIDNVEALPALSKLASTEKALRDLVNPGERTLEVARGQVAQARLSAEQIKSQMDAATLIAPMAGTVTALDVQPGQFASAGQPVVVLSELSDLEVEVNLDETDVAQVSVGQDVWVSLDAFPDVELSGEVTDLAPAALTQAGVVLYPVTISLDLTDIDLEDLPLQSGMTVNATILTESRASALLVPRRAVETSGEQAYVWRVTPGGVERVGVTLGLMTDTEIEILGGLTEGEEVVVYAGSAQGSTVGTTGLSDIFGGGE